MLNFTISHNDPKTLARRGTLELSRGSVQTPAFMPVGTVGVVKTLLPAEVKAMGADIILGNTYHLYLRPGQEEIARFGGLKEWNKWDGPVLTDSGGFQVFSLGLKPSRGEGSEAEVGPRYVKVTEEGITFASHLDGSKHFFTPEKVIDIQLKLGSDIMMVLDECTEYPATKTRAKESMERTHRWAKRAIDYFRSLKNSAVHNLFGISQGSTYQDLRKQSVDYITSLPFDGIAVGGVSVGEGKAHMYQVMDWVGEWLPREKPHYLMGVGEPEDLIRAVGRGFDLFDCVLPTRYGRYGIVWRLYRDKQGNYERFEKWDLRASRFRGQQAVLDESCGCPTCLTGFSRGYIAHLLREREVVGIRLTTTHNLWTILKLMSDIRHSLTNGTFGAFAPFWD